MALNHDSQEKRLLRQNDALVELARLKLHDEASRADALARIIQIAARTLEIERVSVWLFNEDATRLSCIDFYSQSAPRHSEIELFSDQCPDYFKALAAERTIAAECASTDLRTRELSKDYLDPLGIQSLLGVPVRLGSLVFGVVCHEHTGGRRSWRADEEIFAGAIGDLVALTLEAGRLRKQEILRAAFLDVGRHLSTARVPKEAARIVLEIAFQLWGWDACFLHLYCPEEDVCTYVLNMDTVEGQRVEVPQSDPGKEPHPIFRRVMREGARLILRPEDETPVALVPFGNTERPSASLMFVPLRNAQRIAGIISLQSYRPHAYDKEALQAFQALADHCAGALERIYAEEALRRSEERFQTVARATNDALWEWDLLQNEGWSNETFYSLFGCHRKDSGPGLERWYDRIHPEDRDRVLAGIRKLLDKGGETWADEYRFRRADGSYAHVFDRACVVRDGSGKPLRMLGAMMDVTNHKQAEKAMRQFPLRIIEAQERERRRVAHELHDEIGQILTGLKLTMEAMERVSSALAKPHLQQAQGLVNDLIVNVRNLSLDLRPSMLDDLGLLPTFLWYFDRYTAQTGVQVSLTHEGIEARRFGPAAETAAYRIVQEALTNVARHAGVQKASVILWASDEMLQVQVRDSGCGFDPGVKMTAHRSSGLHGMLERAKWLGGDVAVESAPGAGATIAAELPLTPQTDEEEPADAHD